MYVATCSGDASISQQLQMLALLCMHKYPDMQLEDGISQCQWEQKNTSYKLMNGEAI